MDLVESCHGDGRSHSQIGFSQQLPPANFHTGYPPPYTATMHAVAGVEHS
jgi:hypothetical protein